MVQLDINLSFARIEDGESESFSGSVTASGSEVVVFVSDPARLPGNGRRTLAELDTLASALARRGISLRLDGPQGPIIQFGNVKSTLLQRFVTGSAHIRLGTVSALAPLLTKRNAAELPQVPRPPLTLLPLAPTLNRSVPHRVTTTHYERGSGRPRLIFAVGSQEWDGRPPRYFELTAERTLIGSSDDADLQLDGLAHIHAEIRHESDDEYVLYSFQPTGGGAAPDPGGFASRGRILRTGARIDMGKWRLGYFREEFADHGRPFGGRQGGELAVQKSQPPRKLHRGPS